MDKSKHGAFMSLFPWVLGELLSWLRLYLMASNMDALKIRWVFRTLQHLAGFRLLSNDLLR